MALLASRASLYGSKQWNFAFDTQQHLASIWFSMELECIIIYHKRMLVDSISIWKVSRDREGMPSGLRTTLV